MSSDTPMHIHSFAVCAWCVRMTHTRETEEVSEEVGRGRIHTHFQAAEMQAEEVAEEVSGRGSEEIIFTPRLKPIQRHPQTIPEESNHHKAFRKRTEKDGRDTRGISLNQTFTRALPI